VGCAGRRIIASFEKLEALKAEIPRDPTIQVCESMNITVIEGAPNSALSMKYRMLARLIAG
jgi:nitrogenase subunit NifH